MPLVALLLVLSSWVLAVPATAEEPLSGLALQVVHEPHALEVRVLLLDPLPDDLRNSLRSGSPVRVGYPIRVRARRKLWWDRRVWRGDLLSVASFDAITGRYRCEAILDGAIIETREAASIDEASAWLTNPPSVRIVLPDKHADATLKVRARAVFAESTTWLVFPSVEGTDWTEEPLFLSGEDD